MSDYKQTRDAAGKVTTQYDKMLRNLDDDLVKRLREPVMHVKHGQDLLEAWRLERAEAADRIGQLVTTCEQLEAKLAECEARLEKAVELAFDECPFRDGTGSYGDWWRYRRKELEALKGQNEGWKCPISSPNCEENCGNYGCGN